MQINDASALGKIGQFSIDYLPAYQTLSVHRIMLLRGPERIDHTRSATARTMQRETAMEEGVLGGVSTVQLLIDDVRVGDTLWVTYTVEGDNPVFGKKWSDAFSWEGGWPIESRVLTVLHPTNRPLQWRQLGDFSQEKLTPRIDQVGGMNRIRFEGKAIEPLEDEPSVPSDFMAVRVLQFTEYRDWNEVAQWAQGLFPKHAPSASLSALARQFQKESDPAIRTSQALRWVQDQIRYFSVSIGENSHRPQSPDVVLKRRYGDCKDKSYLLVSLLAELGIESRPVLLSASSPTVPARLLPTPTWFDHVVVQVIIDGREYFVDPTITNQPAPLALLPGVVPTAAALPVDRSATALITLPPRAPLLLQETSEQLVIADFSGAASLETRTIYRGVYAERARQVYQKMAPAERKTSALATFEQLYPGVTLSEGPVLKDVPEANQYEVFSRYGLPAAVKLVGKVYQVQYDPRLVDGVLAVPPKLVRQFPLGLWRDPFRGRYRLDVRWPAAVRGYEDPSTVRRDNPYFGIHEEYTFRGNEVSYQLDFHVKTTQVAAAAVPALHQHTLELNQFSKGSFRADQSAIPQARVATVGPRALDQLREAVRIAQLAEGLDATMEAALTPPTVCNAAMAAMAGRAFLDPAVTGLAERLLKRAALPSAPASGCQVSLLFAQGQFARAAAIKLDLDATKADLAGARDLAWARFYAGDKAGALTALATLHQAQVDGKGGSSSSLQLADRVALLLRSGQPVSAADLAAMRAVADGPWPRPLLAMLSGAITPEQLVAQAESLSGDARVLAVGEAWFYLAHVHAARNEQQQAQRAFRLAAASGSARIGAQSQAELKMASGSATVQQNAALNASDKAAAAGGEAASQYALAMLALKSPQATQRSAEIVQWLALAAAQGYAPAQAVLGSMYLAGSGVERDPARALTLLRAGADQGNLDAQYFLAHCYREGLGTGQNLEAAVMWNALGARAGDLRAMTALAYAYEAGNGVAKDLVQARLHMLHAAQGGYPEAQAALGQMIFKGEGGSADKAAGVEWFRKAAALDERMGQMYYGRALLNGWGIRANRSEGLGWLHKAAARGDSDAMYALGNAYNEPGHPDSSAREGVKWTRSAAENGNLDAQYNLAVAYKNGVLLPQDLKQAFTWFLKGAERGDADAAAMLGNAYLEGLGVAKDYAKALLWLHAALKANVSLISGAQPMVDLGLCYEDGLGTARDENKAAEWFKKAASTGDARAIAHLYIMADEGRYGAPLSRRDAVAAIGGRNGEVKGLNAIGRAYLRQKKFAKAQEVYLEAQAHAKGQQNIADPDLVALEGLMRAYQGQALAALHKSTLEEILVLREQRNGAASVELAIWMREMLEFYEQYHLPVNFSLAERLQDLQSRLYGADSKVVVETMLIKAGVYPDDWTGVRAIADYQKIVAKLETIPDSDYLKAITYGRLSANYFRQAQYREAEPLMRRVLAIREAPGAEAQLAPWTYQTLGTVYEKLGNVERAEYYYELAIGLEVKQGRNERGMRATLLHNLGLLYSTTGNYAKAEQLLQQSFDLRDKELAGEERQDVAISLHGLAQLALRRGRVDQARTLFEQALALLEKIDVTYGMNASELYHDYASFLLDSDAVKSEMLLKRALEYRELWQRPEHPELAATGRALSQLYRRTGRIAQAVALEQRLPLLFKPS